MPVDELSRGTEGMALLIDERSEMTYVGLTPFFSEEPWLSIVDQATPSRSRRLPEPDRGIADPRREATAATDWIWAATARHGAGVGERPAPGVKSNICSIVSGEWRGSFPASLTHRSQAGTSAFSVVVPHSRRAGGPCVAHLYEPYAASSGHRRPSPHCYQAEASSAEPFSWSTRGCRGALPAAGRGSGSGGPGREVRGEGPGREGRRPCPWHSSPLLHQPAPGAWPSGSETQASWQWQSSGWTWTTSRSSPVPDTSWAGVTATALDGVDIVLLRLPFPARPAMARNLVARARERRAVLSWSPERGPGLRALTC